MKKYIIESDVIRLKPDAEKPEMPIELQSIERSGRVPENFSTNDHVDYFYELHQYEQLLDSQPTYLKAGDWSRYNIGDEIEESEVEIVKQFLDSDNRWCSLTSFPSAYDDIEDEYKRTVAYLKNEAVVEESSIIAQYQRLFNAISETKGIPIQSEMDDIIRIVHKDFPSLNSQK